MHIIDTIIWDVKFDSAVQPLKREGKVKFEQKREMTAIILMMTWKEKDSLIKSFILLFNILFISFHEKEEGFVSYYLQMQIRFPFPDCSLFLDTNNTNGRTKPFSLPLAFQTLISFHPLTLNDVTYCSSFSFPRIAPVLFIRGYFPVQSFVILQFPCNSRCVVIEIAVGAYEILGICNTHFSDLELW